jgi:hypothetical protein
MFALPDVLFVIFLGSEGLLLGFLISRYLLARRKRYAKLSERVLALNRDLKRVLLQELIMREASGCSGEAQWDYLEVILPGLERMQNERGMLQ